MKTILALFTLSFGLQASAMAILSAHYEVSTDSLVLEVAYSGSHGNHPFSLIYDVCKPLSNGAAPNQIATRLIDAHYNEVGSLEFKEVVSFDLSQMNCRPSVFTVRSGRTSHRTLLIP